MPLHECGFGVGRDRPPGGTPGVYKLLGCRADIQGAVVPFAAVGAAGVDDEPVADGAGAGLKGDVDVFGVGWFDVAAAEGG